MKKPSRRRFLHGSALALPLVTGSLPAWARGSAGETANASYSPEATLAAVAEIALPTQTLGPATTASVLRRFARWSEDFEPVAELDHPYLSTDRIPYGPADPRPHWGAQLEALDLEARKRHGSGYTELGTEERAALLRHQLPEDLPERLPHASLAPHIAVALMSWFFATTEANDLCHGSSIGRHTCRGLPDAVLEPSALTTPPDWDEERQ